MNAIIIATEHWRGHDGGWWFPLFPLLFVGLWVFVLVTVGRRWRRWDHRSGQGVLAERFARGEIDETEYRTRRDVLRQKS